METTFSQFKKVIFSKKNLPLLVLLLLAILLLYLSKFFSSDAAVSEGVDTPKEDALLSYTAYMESKLEETLSLMDGVESVSVMITFEGSVEYSYLTEEKKGSGNETLEETVVIIRESSGNQTPILLKETLPKPLGVLILFEGKEEKKYQITESVNALLSIPSNKIFIAQKKI